MVRTHCFRLLHTCTCRSNAYKSDIGQLVVFLGFDSLVAMIPPVRHIHDAGVDLGYGDAIDVLQVIFDVKLGHPGDKKRKEKNNNDI